MSDLKAAIAFEWTKVRTVRSTFWNLFSYLVVSILFSIAGGLYVRHTYENTGGIGGTDVIRAGHNGMLTGMLALVIFSVLTVTSEYSKGTITSSLTAVPRRSVFYGAKCIVGGAAAFVTSVVVIPVSFFTTQLVMGTPPSVSLLDDAVLQSLFGAVISMTLLGMFSMGVAAILRSSALSISVLLPFFLTISTILTNTPKVGRAARFLPDQAGGYVLLTETPADADLNAWTGLLVLTAWTLGSIAVGFWAVQRRSA